MSNEINKPKITDVTMQIVELLLPLESEARQRVMQASFLLLGETQISTPPPSSSVSSPTITEQDEYGDSLPKQGKIWIKQHNLTLEQLEQIFHLSDGHADVITSEMFGKDTKAKTINAYVLTGLSRLLSVGDSGFDDKVARALCRYSGCYNEANHAVYLKAKGNIMTGSKDAGWKLTAPGLKYGAELVKLIAK